MDDYIGKLVKKFESGSKGSLALGSCGNDWGLSCGSYQLTLRWGNCISFLKKYFPWKTVGLYFNSGKSDFAQKTWPGAEYCSSPEEVQSIWTTCYNEAGADKFFRYEHEYIQNSYYEPLMKKLTGYYNPNNSCSAMQECMWSWAVHRGSSGAYSEFKAAMDTEGIHDPESVKAIELLEICYDKRYAVSGTTRYSTSGGESSERIVLREYICSAPLKYEGRNPTTEIKEESAMKVIEKIATQNPCYKAGKTITPSGIMIHSVGCPQPDPLVFVKNWQSASAQVCVHAVLGTDGNVYQLLPWNWRAWHCGIGSKGSCNNTHISFEMTEPATIAYTSGANWTEKNPEATKAHVLATYKYAVELTSYLCEKYGLNPLADGVVISHSEGNKRGLASNHGDVEHIWSKFGLTMNQFRQDVKAAMGGKVVEVASTDNKSTSDVSESTTGTVVKVTVDSLNIRSGPGTSYTIAGSITDKGSYTVTEISDGWGRLKSGAGWICLSYTNYSGNATSTAATSKFPYTVTITAKVLNVRKGAGTSYGIATTVKKDEKYTIIEESNGWGKLKSGAGWISLEYAKRL